MHWSKTKHQGTVFDQKLGKVYSWERIENETMFGKTKLDSKESSHDRLILFCGDPIKWLNRIISNCKIQFVKADTVEPIFLVNKITIFIWLWMILSSSHTLFIELIYRKTPFLHYSQKKILIKNQINCIIYIKLMMTDVSNV